MPRLTTGKRRQLVVDTHIAGQFFYYFSDWGKGNILSMGILGDNPDRIDRISYFLDKVDDYIFVFQNIDKHYYIRGNNRYLRWSWSRMRDMRYDSEERVYIRDPKMMAIELLTQGYALAEVDVRVVERGKISFLGLFFA